jgi:hypothetical protein
MLDPDSSSAFFADKTTEFLRLQISPIPIYPIYEDLDPSEIFYVPM